MEEFYPSEIARLVLGYLKEVKCQNAWQTFLEESSDLQEHCRLYKEGKFCSTNINGKSLLDILKEYCILKTESLNAEKQNKNTQSNSSTSEPNILKTPNKVNQNAFTKFRINQKLQTQSVVSVSYDKFRSPSRESFSFQSPTSRPGCRTPRRRLDCQATILHFGSEPELKSKDPIENARESKGISPSNTSTTFHNSVPKRDIAVGNENASYSDPVVSSRPKIQDRIVQTDLNLNSTSRRNIDHRNIQTNLTDVPSSTNHSKESEIVSGRRSNTDSGIGSTPDALTDSSYVNLDTTSCLGNSTIQDRVNLQPSRVEGLRDKESIINKNIIIQSSEVTAHEESITVSKGESSVTPQYLPDPPPYYRAPATNSPRIILSYDRSQVPSLTTPNKRAYEELFSPKRKGSIPRRRLISEASPSRNITPSLQTTNENLDFSTSLRQFQDFSASFTITPATWEECLESLAPKIAENINKAMGYEEIKESDALDSHSSLQDITCTEETIQNVVARVEADPTLDEYLSAFLYSRDFADGNSFLEASLTKKISVHKENENDKQLIVDEADSQKQCSKNIGGLIYQRSSNTNEINFEQTYNSVNNSIEKVTESSRTASSCNPKEVSTNRPDSQQLMSTNVQINNSGTGSVSKNSNSNSESNISNFNKNTNELVNKSDPSHEKLNSIEYNSDAVSVSNSVEHAMEVDGMEMGKELSSNNKELQFIHHSKDACMSDNNNPNIINVTNPESHVDPLNNQINNCTATSASQPTLVLEPPCQTYVVSGLPGFPLQNTMILNPLILNPSVGYDATNNPIYLTLPSHPIQTVSTNTAVISPSKTVPVPDISNLGTVGVAGVANIVPSNSLQTDNCITSPIQSPLKKGYRISDAIKNQASQVQMASQRKKGKNKISSQQNKRQPSKQKGVPKRRYRRNPKRKLQPLFPSPPANFKKKVIEIQEEDHPVISIPEPSPSKESQSAFEILNKISGNKCSQSDDLKSLISSAGILMNPGNRLNSPRAHTLDFTSVSNEPNKANDESDNERLDEPSRRSLRIKNSKNRKSRKAISLKEKDTFTENQKNKSLKSATRAKSQNSVSCNNPVKSDCSVKNMTKSILNVMNVAVDEAREKYKSCEKECLNTPDKFVAEFYCDKECADVVKVDNTHISSTCVMPRSEYFPASDNSNSSCVSESQNDISHVQTSLHSVVSCKSPLKVIPQTQDNSEHIIHQENSCIKGSTDSIIETKVDKYINSVKAASDVETEKINSDEKVICETSETEKELERSICNLDKLNSAELQESIMNNSLQILSSRKEITVSLVPPEENSFEQQSKLPIESEFITLGSFSDKGNVSCISDCQKDQNSADNKLLDGVHSSTDKDPNLVKGREILDNTSLDNGIKTDNNIEVSAVDKETYLKPNQKSIDTYGDNKASSQAEGKNNFPNKHVSKSSSTSSAVDNSKSTEEFGSIMSNNSSIKAQSKCKISNLVEEVGDTLVQRKQLDLSSKFTNSEENVKDNNFIQDGKDRLNSNNNNPNKIIVEKEPSSATSERISKSVENTIKIQKHGKVNFKRSLGENKVSTQTEEKVNEKISKNVENTVKNKLKHNKVNFKRSPGQNKASSQREEKINETISKNIENTVKNKIEHNKVNLKTSSGENKVSPQMEEKINCPNKYIPKSNPASSVTNASKSTEEFVSVISNDSSAIKTQSKGKISSLVKEVGSTSAAQRKQLDLSPKFINSEKNIENNFILNDKKMLNSNSSTSNKIVVEIEPSPITSEKNSKNEENAVKNISKHNKVNLKRSPLSSNSKISHSISESINKQFLDAIDCSSADQPEVPAKPSSSKPNLISEKVCSEGNDNFVSCKKGINVSNHAVASSSNSEQNFKSKEKKADSIPTINIHDISSSSKLGDIQKSSNKDVHFTPHSTTDKQSLFVNEDNISNLSTNEVTAQSAKIVPPKKRIRPVPVCTPQNIEPPFSPFMSSEINVNANIMTCKENLSKDELIVRSNEGQGTRENEKSVVNENVLSNSLPTNSLKTSSSDIIPQKVSNSLSRCPVAHSPLKNIVSSFHSPNSKNVLSGKPKAMADFYRNVFPDKNGSLPISPVSFSSSSCTADAFLAKRKLLNTESPAKVEQNIASEFCNVDVVSDKNKNIVARIEEINPSEKSYANSIDNNKLEYSPSKNPLSTNKQNYKGEECLEEIHGRKRKLSESYFSDTCSTLADCSDLEIVTPEKDDSFYKSPLFSIESPVALKKRKKINALCSSPEVTPEKMSNSRALSHCKTLNKSSNPQIIFLKPKSTQSQNENVSKTLVLKKFSPNANSLPNMKLQQEIQDKDSSTKQTEKYQEQLSHNSVNDIHSKKKENEDLVKNIPQNVILLSDSSQKPAEEKSVETFPKSLLNQSSDNKIENPQDKKIPDVIKDTHKKSVENNEISLSKSCEQIKPLQNIHKTNIGKRHLPEAPSINSKVKKSHIYQNTANSSSNKNSHKLKGTKFTPSSLSVKMPAVNSKKVEESPVRNISNTKKTYHKSALIKKTEQDPNFPAGVKLPSKWNSSKISSYSNEISQLYEDNKRHRHNNFDKKVRRSRPTLKIATLKSPSKTDGKMQNLSHSLDASEKEKVVKIKTVSKCDSKNKKQNDSSMPDNVVISENLHEKEINSNHEKKKLQVTQNINLGENNNPSSSKVLNESITSSSVSYKKNSLQISKQQTSNFIDTCESTRDIVEKDIGRSDEPGSEVANAIANLTRLHSSESPGHAFESSDRNFSQDISKEEVTDKLEIGVVAGDPMLARLQYLVSKKVNSGRINDLIALLEKTE